MSWPGRLAKPLERVEAARAELHVERVGELRAHATRGLAGRAGAERVALDQQHVPHARLGEMEGDADAHDAAAHDDDRRVLRQFSGIRGGGFGHWVVLAGIPRE